MGVDQAAEASRDRDSSSGSAIKSAERVMDILDLVSSHHGGLGFTDFRVRLGIPKSSLHGLLRVLSERGYLELDPESRKYFVGLRAWQAGRAFARAEHMAANARPHLRIARDTLNETFQMAILDGLDNVYIAKEESDHPLRLVSEVGGRLPAHATGLGKVLLSALSDEELTRRLDGVDLQSFTKTTVTSVTELRRLITQVRTDGLARDYGEYTHGLCCLAVPVQDSTGAIVAAISCSVPEPRLNEDGLGEARILDVLSTTAAAIAKDL